MCDFSNGYVHSVSFEELANTNSANEWAILVKAERSTAIGVTWYNDGTNKCYAQFGNPATSTILEDDEYLGCLFSGKYIVSEAFTYKHISHFNWTPN